ncbi:MAG: LysR family transcriptional regulator [Burkholderiales bacterium]
MANPIGPERRISRRLKLRDLYILAVVDQHGSMAQAAKELGMAQPSVSEVIAGIEDNLGVRLLDRSPQGVQTTRYGRVLLRRAHVVFDELSQAVKEIQYLSDPSVGEVRFSCPESISASLLPPVIADFARRHPGIALQVDQKPTLTMDLPELQERKLDFIIARLNKPLDEDRFRDEVALELLFNDELVLVAAKASRWARRRNLSLGDLAEARWIQNSPGSWGDALVDEMFQTARLPPPRAIVRTLSVSLRNHLVSTGDFVTVMPKSVLGLSAARFGLQMLPLRLPRPWPVFLATVKNRTLSPQAALFLGVLRKHVPPVNRR